MSRAPVAAVVLAAGRSLRMGQPKLVLPWGERTIIGQVAAVLLEAGVSEVVVVTGGAQEAVQRALAGYPVRLVANPGYEQSEMTTSLQVGIRALSTDCAAALVALGDQPQIEAGVVEALVDRYRTTGAGLVVPSYQMRRGHPWLVDRALWPDLLALNPNQTLRDFLNARAAGIQYLPVNTSSVLADIDTPEDYRRAAGTGR